MGNLQTGDLPAAVSAANDDVISDELQKTRMQKETKLFLLLSVLFLFGVLLGALFVSKTDGSILNTLDYLFFSSIQRRVDSTLFSIFVSSAASSFLFLTAVFFGGLTMWGTPILPILPFFRGFGLGLIGGYVYQFGAVGIFYQILVILPGALCSAFAILFASSEAMRFSSQMNRSHRLRKNLQHRVHQPSVRNYVMRLGVISILALIGAGLDTGTSSIFSGLWKDFI